MDVSSFLLVEESADSEADGFLTWEMCRDIAAVAAAGGGELDDAESCSCDDTSDDQVFDNDNHDVVLDDQDFIDCDDGGVIDDGDQLRWNTTARSCKLWLGYMSTEEGEEEESSRVGFKRKVKDDEMEDRVFWETCMAVGYP